MRTSATATEHSLKSHKGPAATKLKNAITILAPTSPARQVLCLYLAFLFALAQPFALPETGSALAHGFNADWVQITRLPTGKYRVIIKYTHVEAGEFREAHADFSKKEEAIEVYQKLAQGADFFLGNIKESVHFHKPPEKNSPY